MEYVYSANGNRSAEIVGSDTTEYGYANNRLVSLSGATQASFSYDDNGNLVSQVMGSDTVAFGYDQLNRLVSVTCDDTTFVETYNSRGQRQLLITPRGTSLYIHAANGLMLSEYYDGAWEGDYVYLGGLPIARLWAYNEEVDTTTTTHYDISWYHNDHLGTPLVVTDSAKTIRWSAQYYPFGTLASENVSLSNNVRFPGQYHDRSTDLHYNMFRYYHPVLGRYLTPDPIGLAGGINLYGYAGQNPVNYVDPWGLFEVSGRVYGGLGVGFRFGYSEGRFFGSIEGGIGLGVGIVFDPESKGPEHLQPTDDDVTSGFTVGVVESGKAGVYIGPLAGGIGYVDYHGVGLNETEQGQQGCGDEVEDPNAPFGPNSPSISYSQTENYLNIRWGRWAFGYGAGWYRTISVGFHAR